MESRYPLWEIKKVFQLTVGDNLANHNTVRSLIETRDEKGRKVMVVNEGDKDEWQAGLHEPVRVFIRYEVD